MRWQCQGTCVKIAKNGGKVKNITTGKDRYRITVE